MQAYRNPEMLEYRVPVDAMLELNFGHIIKLSAYMKIVCNLYDINCLQK